MYTSTMPKWIVTGASGSLATACISELLERNRSVLAFSRSEVYNLDEGVTFSQVTDYSNLEIPPADYEGILVTQGFFHYELFERTSKSNLENLVVANFLSQIQVVQSFLKVIDKNKKTNIVVIGSTNAFASGMGTAVYGATKAAMLAFVEGMNHELIDSNIRFSFASMGTMANEMGFKVPNQDPTTLLQVDFIAREIVRTITCESNSWQPVITIRRRNLGTIR